MSKFVSVNLNKSYGQPPSRNNAGVPGAAPLRNNAGSSGRARPVNYGGGGMVVLSRPRSSGAGGMQKIGPRLSVPPPLNLPSLRKEHERLDPSLSASGGSVGTGNQSGPASSGMGWTKPARIEKDGGGDGRSDGGEKRNNVYTPPAARLGMGGSPLNGPARAFVPTVDKAVLLRGEDFPSLQASLPSAPPSGKQKQKLSEEVRNELVENSSSRLPVSTLPMRPAMGSSRLTAGNRSDENGGSGRGSRGFRVVAEDSRDRDRHMPSPLPIVRLSHTSDWADDERDTSTALVDRDRDRGFPKTEVEFDIPRVVPSRTYGQPDANSGKVLSRDIFKVRDLYGRDAMTPNQDGNPWRISSSLKDGHSARGNGIERNGVGVRPFGVSKETSKENSFSQLPYRDSRDGFSNTINGFRDSKFIRRDSGYGQSGQSGNHVSATFNGRGSEQNMRGRFSDFSNRNRGDVFQNSSMPKSLFSSGSKGLPLNDPILNFRREKGIFSNSGKPLLEDAFVNDSFSTGLIGDIKVFKRKKDVLKQADYHDPVRESFEAELERVQKMQERERQRVVEEQARALELARKEEEERERLFREEEEQRRRLEEEAREAAVKAEQERVESLKRAEEQKMAREGERMRILLEEERRKEAAKQKLLELEARIARRQAEATTKDDKFPTAVGCERILGPVKEREVVTRVAADIGDWEDGERMVERITSSASSDSSTPNRSFDTGSRPHSSRDGSSNFLNRGKHTTSWQRDGFENVNGSSFLLQDQDNGYRSPRRDVFGGGRAFARKEFYGGPGVISSRASSKGGMMESHMVDDFSHLRGHRWNPEMDAEFSENTMDGFGDIGWGHGRSRGSPHAPYADRFFQGSEFDGFSSFGRSRHSMRQPRVLPPPSLPSMHRSSFRADSEHSGSLAFADGETRYQHAARSEQVIMATPQENTIHEEQKEEKNTLRCDSQSSLSVSSPPSSPTHLSHDDLDDSEDGEQIAESDNEHVESAPEGGNSNIMTVSNSVSPCEDEEWDIDNDEELQVQEEYDEEEDGYNEEDELHEGDDENLDLVEEFEDLNSEEQLKTADETQQQILGFDEGVEGAVPSNDEIERNSRNVENTIGKQPISVATVQDPGTFDDLVSNGHTIQTANNTSEVKTMHETEKTMPVDTHQNALASTNFLVDCVASSSGILSQQPVTSAVNTSLPSPSVQPILSTVSTTPNQSDIPVKLQFGLFSGPSLIPSPVPAIQIGSIQMPLHIHPQVGPSISQMQPSQTTFYQFGQFRYPITPSPGVYPSSPPTMSFVQPTVSTHYSFSQNLGGPLHYQAGQDSSTQNPHLHDKVSSPENLGKELEVLPEADSVDNGVLLSQNQPERSLSSEKMAGPESVSQVEDDQGRHNASVKRNYRSTFNSRESHGQLYSEFSSERNLSGSRAPGTISGSKGKRFVYVVRNSGSRSFFPASEASEADFNGFQRKARRNTRRNEFRVWENVDSRRTEGLVSSNHPGPDEDSNLNGRVSGNSTQSRGQKDAAFNKSTKSMIESKSLLTSGSYSSRIVDSESKMEKSLGKEVPSNRKFSSSDISRSREGNPKKNGSSEEDVDAPLQSGVVCVFKQPGIEAPSDEDDFIEVRSKRQMLNDRREQREKEIKAKSVLIKTPRKSRHGSQSTVVSSNSNRAATTFAGEAANSVRSESVVADGRGFANVEASTGFSTIISSQPLPPIGTPVVNNDSQADKRSLSMKTLQRSSVPVTPSGGENLVPGLSFENKNVVPTSLGSWANPPINQQVMALTQTQLDEAMKPVRFDSPVASIGEHSSIVVEYSKPSTSVSTHDKSFSSLTSPLNSLLAGEKIQFGAVTSPTILPPISRAVSNGIGSLGSCRSAISSNITASENDRTFFDKDKNPSESQVHLEDPEAEAEAAASAVAVAAISSDELVVGNVLGACSVSVSDTKNFVGADVDGLPSDGGMAGNQQLNNQSRGEESLTVALPADLSVETPSLSLWPPLPSPQSSSCAMLSPFAGAPPSHFPCYEMNPMLGGPIFAFGPHDESANAQSSSQKSNISGSAPLGGAWQQCHSGVDTSFYGPPAGFTGPFIGPPGGIPGVQGPPHMVVYNHFAPVGQFGQVGLSYMGTTYIPSGKQPDWKHNPVSSAVGISEGDVNNLNMVSGQRNPHMQHLAPGSPLLPMASPLAMFDMSPFQTSADIPPMQARWSYIPTSPLHSVPLSMPLQPQQTDMGPPSQFTHGLSSDSSTLNMYHEARSQPNTDNTGRNLPAVTLATTSQFPDELGLVDHAPSAGNGPTSYSSTNGKGKAQIIGKGSLRSPTVSIGGESGNGSSSSSNHSNCNSIQSMNSTVKTQAGQQQPSAQRYLRPIGYSEQRSGGVSQKMGSGGEWQHRRVAGFQGKNQSLATDKNSAVAKVKQIYVAKPSTTGTSAV